MSNEERRVISMTIARYDSLKEKYQMSGDGVMTRYYEAQAAAIRAMQYSLECLNGKASGGAEK